LIWKASKRYPNWNPVAADTKLGSYGKIDNNTGLFIMQGNVFELKSKDAVLLFDRDEPVRSEVIGEYHVNSRGVYCSAFVVDFDEKPSSG